MVTLALDTSTRTGSCAVLRGDLVMAEVPGDPGRSHAERLPLDLMTALERSGVALADVDVFAVAVGPGSFTGLRVGIATMQGLALAAARPLVGVSVLDALARASAGAADAPGRVAAWVDAWRGEVYAALFGDGLLVEPPTVERPQRLLERLQGTPTLFIGDGAAVHREAIAAAMGPLAVLPATLDPLLAGVIGQMALALVGAGHRPGPADVQPLYVRRPGVELLRETHDHR